MVKAKFLKNRFGKSKHGKGSQKERHRHLEEIEDPHMVGRAYVEEGERYWNDDDAKDNKAFESKRQRY